MIEAELHDGTVLEFPDGTNPAIIQGKVKEILAGKVSYPGMAAEALGRGVQGVVDMPRALGEFAAGIDQKARNKGVGPLIPNPLSALKYAPRGSDVVTTTNRPENQPVSMGQKIVAGAIEAAPGGLLFGPSGIVPSMAAGAAGETAKEMGGGTGAQIAASIPAAMTAAGAQNFALRAGKAFTGPGNATVQAMTDEKIPLNLAGTASGSKWAQQSEQALSQSFSGGGTIRTAAERANQSIGDAVERAASTQGGSRNAIEAGRVIQEGISGRGGFVDRFKADAGRHYGALDSMIPGSTPVGASNTRIAASDLRQTLAGMPETAKGLTPKLFNSIEADLATANAVPFSTLSRLRSEVGAKLADSVLVGDVSRGDLKKLYAALSSDMETAANAAGAGAAFSRASKHWQAGMQRMEDNLQRLADARVPERAFELAMIGNKRGATDLYALRRSLKPDEWGHVSAATLRMMGSKTAGTGEAFDISTFLNNWNKMSQEAKAALFRGPGMRDYARSVDNLATMADAFGKSATMANRSNTSGNSYLLSVLTSGAGAGIGLAAGEATERGWVAPVAGAVLAPWAAAKLMTSPAFVKYLSTPVSKNQLPQRLAALSGVVSQEPDIADAAKEFLRAVSDQQEKQ